MRDMKQKTNPCVICEAYIEGIECENDGCPVHEMKQENERLHKTVQSLRSKIRKIESDKSWDEDIRRGQVQGMW